MIRKIFTFYINVQFQGQRVNMLHDWKRFWYLHRNKQVVLTLLNTGRKPVTFLVRGVLRDVIRFVLVVDELYIEWWRRSLNWAALYVYRLTDCLPWSPSIRKTSPHISRYKHLWLLFIILSLVPMGCPFSSKFLFTVTNYI